MFDDLVWLAVYGDEGGNSGGGNNPPPVPPPSEEDKPTLSQKKVNQLLAEERRKNQAKNEELAKQLQQWQESANLTAKEKEEIAVRLEELQTSHLTKEEQAKREREKFQKEYEKQLATASQERDSWKTRFHESHKRRAIVDAAAASDAFNPDQFVNQLLPSTSLVEVNDEDGKPTGQFQARVRFSDTTKDGQPITLDLTVPDAIKRMKELEQYHNFFKANLQSGLGGGHAGGSSKQKEPKDMSTEEYDAWRKKQPWVKRKVY